MELLMITGLQLRAALGVLNWSIKDLKEHTGLGSTFLSEMKSCDGIKPNAMFASLETVRQTIKNALIEKRKELSGDELIVFDSIVESVTRQKAQ